MSSIGHRAARGVTVLAGRTLFVQILQVVSSIVTARHLAPSSYGAFAIATALLGFAKYIGDLGVANSFILSSHVSDAKMRLGSCMAVVLAGISASVILLLGDSLASVLGGRASEEGALVMYVLSLTLVIDALRFGPTVRLTRELQFGRIGVIGVVESAVLFVTQIVALLLGFGLAALVAAQVLRSLTGTVTAAVVGGGISLRWPTFEAAHLIKVGFPFQVPAIITGAVGFFLPVVVASQLKAHGLGLWAWATVLATPLLSLLLVLQSVVLPSLAALRRERSAERADEATSLLLRVVLLLAAVGGGVLFGFAERIISEIFDPRWLGAVGAVRVTLIGVVPLSLATVLAAAVESRFRPVPRAIATAIAAATALALVVPLAHAYGVTGAALATALVMPLVDSAVLLFVAKIAVGRAMVNVAITFPAVIAISSAAASIGSGLITLVPTAAATAIVAIALAFVVDRAAVLQLWRAARRRASTTEGPGSETALAGAATSQADD
jgi:O-antigen/teichoic acid export membrane protein